MVRELFGDDLTSVDALGVGMEDELIDYLGDNLIEGVERTDKRFCIGVQWHPERIGHIGLYRALVEAARGS